MDRYFIKLESRVAGPFTAEQLRGMAKLGKIGDAHMVSVNHKDWLDAKQVKGLFGEPDGLPAAMNAPPPPGGSYPGMSIAYGQASPVQTPASFSSSPPMQGNSWHFSKNGQVYGPLSDAELLNLAISRGLGRDDPVWLANGNSRLPAWQTPLLAGVFGEPADLDDSHEDPEEEAPIRRSKAAKRRNAKKSAVEEDLKLLPLDADTINLFMNNRSFPTIMLLGALPLFVGSLNDGKMQLTGLLMYFAMLWGWIFRNSLLKVSESVTLPIIACLFTGLIGIKLLLLSHAHLLPTAYLQMPDSSDKLTSLIGFIVQTGVCEEICKLLPVFIYLVWKQDDASPGMVVMLAVFSGLGFGIFENMDYAGKAVDRSISISHQSASATGMDGAVRGAAIGTIIAMMETLMRSESLVFCHAIWSGVSGCYLVMSKFGRGEWFVSALLAIAIPALLHGVYDWLCGIQLAYAAIVIVVNFILLVGCLEQIRPLFSDENTE